MARVDPERMRKALADERWSAAAQTSMRAEAIATWDPGLPRDARLLVPVDVQALVVPRGGGVSAVPTEVLVPLAPEGAPLEDVLPRRPAPFGDPADREPGVHLHWAMPDGLTRGDAGTARAGATPAGNPGGHPALPDRWVVVRMPHGRDAIRSWILEADRGDRHELAGWTEPGPLPESTRTGAAGRRHVRPERLTATAGGDLAWAATYDAVLDRFALHDDLADIGDPAGTRLSYLVAGWWSQPGLDPLHDVTTLGDYTARTRRLGWQAPAPEGLEDDAVERRGIKARREDRGLKSPSLLRNGLAVQEASDRRDVEMTSVRADLVRDARAILVQDTPAAPRQTLLHGAVLGVAANGDGPDQRPAPDALNVALGPSGFSAFAALIADGGPADRAGSERLLAAFSANLLARLDAPEGLAAVDEERHGAGFVARAGRTRPQPDRVADGDLFATGDASQPRKAAAEVPFRATEKAGSVLSGKSPRAKLVRREKHKVLGDALTKRFETIKRRAPRTFRDVATAEPRFFVPADLAVVVQGASRSRRHGNDGRFTPQGLLACRLPTQVVGAYRGVLDLHDVPRGLRSVGSGAVPSEVDLLLREAVLTDPYRWRELVDWGAARNPGAEVQVATRLRAELLLRHTPVFTDRRSPVADTVVTDALRRASVADGTDVSPVGVTRWAQAWVPLWLDWELALRVDEDLTRWSLGPVDLQAGGAPDAPGPERVVSGRCLLASSTGRAFAQGVLAWLEEERRRDESGLGQLSEVREEDLAQAAAAARDLDLLTGALAGVRETLLGLDPERAALAAIDAGGAVRPEHRPLPAALPSLLAGGAATVRRLRVVDAFGRWIDVPDAVLARLEVAETHRHPQGAPRVCLPPRLQRPARLVARFVDPAQDDGAEPVEARIDQERPQDEISPVSGWLLPDHVDEALEAFDSAGQPLGQLLHDELTGAVVWEAAPGRPGPIGGAPDTGGDPAAQHVARFAAGLVAADAAARADAAQQPESALAALLRGIDTTLWTVDPLGTLGTAAVAGLVGRPIAVVRAVLRLDVQHDLDELAFADAAGEAARRRAYDELVRRAIAVRLGELTRTDDALLAYVVDDDYSRVHLVAPELRDDARAGGRLRGQLATFGHGSQDLPERRTIVHPYVSTESELLLRPGHPVRLTLLMHPGGKVHVTSGVVPRKSLALARGWFHEAVERLSPSIRVGPVLVDPTGVRMPRVTGLGDEQTFTRRDTPLTWRDDPILAASQAALLPDEPADLQEGWIRVVGEHQEGAS